MLPQSATVVLGVYPRPAEFGLISSLKLDDKKDIRSAKLAWSIFFQSFRPTSYPLYKKTNNVRTKDLKINTNTNTHKYILLVIFVNYFSHLPIIHKVHLSALQSSLFCVGKGYSLFQILGIAPYQN